MIEVDTANLKTALTTLETLINEYEEIELNLFNQLNQVGIDWQDGNATIFADKIYLDKKESDLYVQSLKAKKDVTAYVYERYSSLGKKIRCNLNSRTTVLRALEECQNRAISLARSFENIDINVLMTEKDIVESQRKKINKVAATLTEIKKDTSKMYDQIETIEKNVEAKIRDLEKIKINDFGLELE